MSKISFHIQKQGIQSWLKAEIIQSKVSWLKVLHPDEYGGIEPMAGTGYAGKYIGRLWWPGDVDKSLVYQGAEGADKWLWLAAPKLEKCGWCDVIEGPNEPYIATADDAKAIVEFELARTEHLHRLGFESGSYVFSDANPFMALWSTLGSGIGDYLVLHEYGLHEMTWDGWHLGRYRKVLALLKEHGYPAPKILITESGIDVAGNPLTDGWRVQLKGDETEYMRQIIASSAEWDKDDEIETVTLFTCQDDGWLSFAHDYSIVHKLSTWLASESPDPIDVGAIMADLGQRYIIPLNYGAALLKAGTARGYSPVSPEFTTEVVGTQYVVQGFMDVEKPGMQFWAYCKYGAWDDVLWALREN